MTWSDKSLGLGRAIPRRDFLQGAAIGAATTLAGMPALSALAGEGSFNPEKRFGYYPPALTGLRGSHAGSFEAAHALARDGVPAEWPLTQTDTDYDLIVVGGGISGLAAAFSFREQAGPDARILILENHDDFGGHAKRNEFRSGNRVLIGYGGSQSMEAPAQYGAVMRDFLRKLGVDKQRFYTAFDQDFYKSRNMGDAYYFNKEKYGVDRVLIEKRAASDLGGLSGTPIALEDLEWTSELPFSEEGRADMKRLLGERRDYLEGRTEEEKAALLRSISYSDYLRKHVGVNEEVVDLYLKLPHSYWGIGSDALPAYECLLMGYPGFAGLGLEAERLPSFDEEAEDYEPYIFHFPDGNASIARMVVRALIPDSAPGNTMDDIVTAPMDYAKLDVEGSATRLRLNSTVVGVRHFGPVQKGSPVDVTYMRGGKAHRVRGAHCILACYNMLIPHLCPELPQAQKDGLTYGVKIPNVYTNVLLRHWQPFYDQGLHYIYSPGNMFTTLELDFPVSMGGYEHPKNPDEPIILHLVHAPTEPNQGLTAREQHRIGRDRLLQTEFEVFEREIRGQLTGMLSSSSAFDPAEDIMAITVNRWPHGYAYEPLSLYDESFPPGQAPFEIGRKAFGQISIANSDAGGVAFLDTAVEQGYRAVQEQLS